LARSITKKWQTAAGEVPVLMLAFELEETLTRAIQHTDHGSYLTLEPKLAQGLIAELTRALEKFALTQHQVPILLTSPGLRPHLKRLTEPFLPQLIVLSQSEIVSNVPIKNLGVVRI
jgi:flagellar biosynthesis protein FlhA